jgi:hypothetical protein
MNKVCIICNAELTDGNTSRWDIPGTEKHGTIRKDSQGKEWCQACTDEHDSIDWEALRNG